MQVKKRIILFCHYKNGLDAPQRLASQAVMPPFGMQHGSSCQHIQIKTKKPTKVDFFFLAGAEGLARLRAERWSALTATGSHSLPTLRVLQNLYAKNKTALKDGFIFWQGQNVPRYIHNLLFCFVYSIICFIIRNCINISQHILPLQKWKV